MVCHKVPSVVSFYSPYETQLCYEDVQMYLRAVLSTQSLHSLKTEIMATEPRSLVQEAINFLLSDILWITHKLCHQMHPLLPQPQLQTIPEIFIHDFSTSHEDHCNWVLFGVPFKALDRLQYPQNLATRILNCTNPWQHIPPTLKRLHRLPVKIWISFANFCSSPLNPSWPIPHNTSEVSSMNLPHRGNLQWFPLQFPQQQVNPWGHFRHCDSLFPWSALLPHNKKVQMSSIPSQACLFASPSWCTLEYQAAPSPFAISLRNCSAAAFKWIPLLHNSLKIYLNKRQVFIYYSFIFAIEPLYYSPDNSWLLKTPRYEALLLVTSACHVQLQREATTHDMPAELESHSYSASAQHPKLHIVCLASSHAFLLGI